MAGLLNESTIKAQKTSLLESYKKDIANTEAALGRELKFEQKLSLNCIPAVLVTSYSDVCRITL